MVARSGINSFGMHTSGPSATFAALTRSKNSASVFACSLSSSVRCCLHSSSFDTSGRSLSRSAASSATHISLLPSKAICSATAWSSSCSCARMGQVPMSRSMVPTSCTGSRASMAKLLWLTTQHGITARSNPSALSSALTDA